MWYDLVTRAKNEPVFVYSLVEAGIALAVTFGLNLDAHQLAGIFAVLAILTGVAARQQTYGPKTVDGIIDADSVISAAERS